ncbi:IS630 family transposase [Halosquirtibacter laminarini]|uniref:IS630 family transposase n=1 Tax=Halosquirtibacter laminarini TaxID=3374600 RepID=A0AC61NK61_9BACT|nr:IS630 family transposase [Prolixibacteraceae bacterium]
MLLPSSRSKALNVIGAMNRKNEIFYEVHETTINSDILISFIDKLCNQITKKTILVLDNAPIHRSKKFKAKIEEWNALDLYIYFIPPYSPELNIIEILWKHIKYFWLEFKAYESYNSLKKCLLETLGAFGLEHTINFA